MVHDKLCISDLLTVAALIKRSSFSSFNRFEIDIWYIDCILQFIMMSTHRIQRICCHMIMLFLFLCGGEGAYHGCRLVEARTCLHIEGIELRRNPDRMEIRMDARPPYKIVAIGQKEYLIALKNVTVSHDPQVSGEGLAFITDIGVDQPSSRVVTIVVNTRHRIPSLDADWDASRKTLTIVFATSPRRTVSGSRSEEHVRHKAKAPQYKKQARGSQVPLIEASASDAVDGLHSETFHFAGTMDDFWLEVNEDRCLDDITLLEGVQYHHAGQWHRAFGRFSDYIRQNPSNACLEKACYMRAYSFYQNTVDSNAQALTAINYFDRAVNRFPQSDYIPYAYVAMGKLYHDLKNSVQAKAYFNLVLDEYPDYHGRPEAMFELARICLQTNQPSRAISLYRNILAEFPQSQLTTPTRLELAQVMYQEKDYPEVLKIMAPLTESTPRIMYESPDWLLQMGNAYYHTGAAAKARSAFAKALNCFPAISSKDRILSRIADSFIEQRQPHKARKIYEYIVENYPETDGYVTGLVRLAQFSNQEDKKTRLYRKVVEQFPSHSLSRLAMIRLAGLYNQQGDFQKSIPLLENILNHRSDLFKDESLQLMQDAYLAVFKKMLQQGDYPNIMMQYEKKKSMLDQLQNGDIFAMIGKAYIKADLYPQAYALLKNAYEQEETGRHGPDMMYHLGVAMQETQRDKAALRMFDILIQRYPDNAYMKDACHRGGLIYMQQEAYQKAIRKFQIARRHTSNSFESTRILIDEALACQAAGQLQAAAASLVKAINELAAEAGNHSSLIADTYRRLGEVYMISRDYLKAADAFSMSARFYQNHEKHSEITFSIADAYTRAKQPDKALRYYNQVIETDAPLWAKLARERIREMDLNQQLQKQSKALSL
jgi:TolA-binding protein